LVASTKRNDDLAVNRLAGKKTHSYILLGNATQVPENPGNPPIFKPVNPGLYAGQKIGFEGFNFVCQCTQNAHSTARVHLFAVNPPPDIGIR